MKHIKIKCDRCQKIVDGILEDMPVAGIPKYTGGFYNVQEEPWKRFALERETTICDICMHSDDMYRAHYHPRIYPQ